MVLNVSVIEGTKYRRLLYRNRIVVKFFLSQSFIKR